MHEMWTLAKGSLVLGMCGDMHAVIAGTAATEDIVSPILRSHEVTVGRYTRVKSAQCLRACWTEATVEVDEVSAEQGTAWRGVPVPAGGLSS